MTPCEKKNYKVGQVFEITNSNHFGTLSDNGDLLGYIGNGAFLTLNGRGEGLVKCNSTFSAVKRVYPPEEESKTVDVVCEGKTTTLTREDAKKLNLC